MQLPRAFMATRWPDLWEYCRRFSGLSAVLVLGLAMVWLAVRADLQPTVVVREVPVAVAQEPVTTTPNKPAMRAYFRPIAQPSIVFYLYDDDAAYLSALKIEAQAANESGDDSSNADHQFYTLDASTPEAERIARDTIFAAVVANTSGARILVRDLRQD